MTQYDITYNIYNKNREEIDKLISSSRFPQTFLVLKSFVSKIEELYRSLEMLEAKKCFYSSQCLVRVLNEHFLVIFYIWNKCRLHETDDCARDYMEYYGLFEMIKRENYNSKLDKSYDTKKTPLQNFFAKAPEFESDVTEEDVPDLNQKANQFDVRNILKFMQNQLVDDDPYKPLAEIVLNNCRKYNETSTYIHGGRLAELQAFENTPETNHNAVMNYNSSLAKIYVYHTLSFLMLLLILENPDFVKKYQPVIDFIATNKGKGS